MDESPIIPASDEISVDPPGDKFSKARDIFVIVFLGWMLLVAVFWSFQPRLMDRGFDWKFFEIIGGVLQVFGSLMLLLLAFAIRNKAIKIIVFILAGLYFHALLFFIFYYMLR